MNSLKAMAMKRVGDFAQQAGKKYVCEGDISTIKTRAIQAIQMMPDALVANMLKASPICSPGSSMSSMFQEGGKKRKTRKQKRKQRKTRKH